jgi:isopenicillin-N N-acyltransferase like protein
MPTSRPSRPLRLIDLSGPPYERGRRYGEEAGAEIRRAISHYSAQLRTLALTDERLATLVARYLPRIEAFEPRYVEELRGIAAGAQVDFERIVMVNARTELLKLAEDKGFCQRFLGLRAEGCTTVVVESHAAKDGALIHAHNWDWKTESADASVILRIRGTDGPDILTFTEAGALGRFGLNSVGIAVTANYLECDRDYSQLGVPLAVIRRKVLEQVTVGEAAAVVCNTPKSGSNNLTVSHGRSGLAFNFECAPDEAFEVEPEEGLLVHANHWRSPAARVKLRERGFAEGADSLFRDRRARQLLADRRGGLTVEDVKRTLLDDCDTPFSICQPPGYPGTPVSHATVATLIMRPSLGTMEVAVLPAVDPTFTSYALDPRGTVRRRAAGADG